MNPFELLSALGFIFLLHVRIEHRLTKLERDLKYHITMNNNKQKGGESDGSNHCRDKEIAPGLP